MVVITLCRLDTRDKEAGSSLRESHVVRTWVVSPVGRFSVAVLLFQFVDTHSFASCTTRRDPLWSQ